MEQAQFVQILNCLVSTNTRLRRQAEIRFDNLSTDIKVKQLLQTIQNTSASGIRRRVAAVLLRYIFVKGLDKYYQEQTPEGREQLFQQLLICCNLQDATPSLKLRMRDVLFVVVEVLLDEEPIKHWIDFFILKLWEDYI